MTNVAHAIATETLTESLTRDLRDLPRRHFDFLLRTGKPVLASTVAEWFAHLWGNRAIEELDRANIGESAALELSFGNLASSLAERLRFQVGFADEVADSICQMIGGHQWDETETGRTCKLCGAVRTRIQ